jgi:hypothetical protein
MAGNGRAMIGRKGRLVKIGREHGFEVWEGQRRDLGCRMSMIDVCLRNRREFEVGGIVRDVGGWSGALLFHGVVTWHWRVQWVSPNSESREQPSHSADVWCIGQLNLS